MKKEKYKRMTKIIFLFKKHNNFNYSFKEKIVNSNDVNKFLS
ncbi:hypothetical protein DMIN_00490 [Candidatus Karelsulcia muelleri DMIN]|nr:hypothetical protein DMIN_00490 [Candidatus Karelsulcia muelleri DMIN]